MKSKKAGKDPVKSHEGKTICARAVAITANSRSIVRETEAAARTLRSEIGRLSHADDD
jgi:hypothetical protein